jgi:phosphoribosyl 1,2-cyclic phosphodiesterase
MNCMEIKRTFKIKFYGARGSVPVSGADFQKFGGNTTCIQIQGTDDFRLGIIDAGTGIRDLGRDLLSRTGLVPKEILIGFTHFHWDHIQGLPFFKPAYDPAFKVRMIALGQDRGIDDLKKVFEVQMRKEYFPVPLDKMGAKFEFVLEEKESDQYNQTRATAVRHSHPGGAYSYKLQQGERKIVISTDIEHGDSLDENIIELARDADLLIHDAQYTSEELEQYRGWGHSSYDQAIEVAERAGVKKLIMTHHDPDHDDDFLSRMEDYCQKRFPACALAREGMEIVI